MEAMMQQQSVPEEAEVAEEALEEAEETVMQE